MGNGTVAREEKQRDFHVRTRTYVTISSGLQSKWTVSTRILSHIAPITTLATCTEIKQQHQFTKTDDQLLFCQIKLFSKPQMANHFHLIYLIALLLSHESAHTRHLHNVSLF